MTHSGHFRLLAILCFIEKKTLRVTCFNFSTETEIALVANLSSAEAVICPRYTILMPGNRLRYLNLPSKIDTPLIFEIIKVQLLLSLRSERSLTKTGTEKKK